MPKARFRVRKVELPGHPKKADRTMTMTKKQILDTDDTHLENDAEEVLHALQESLRLVIRDVPGESDRPSDLARNLDIQPTLAWQIHRFAHANNVFAEVRMLPGRLAMTRFLEAAERRGASSEKAVQARIGMESFDRLNSRYAKNRKEFESLLVGLTQSNDENVDLVNRRNIFHGQSHVLGFCADTNLSCVILAPSHSDTDLIDAVSMHSITGLRRFRRDVSIVVATLSSYHENGTPMQRIPEAIDLESQSHETFLIPELCSKPIPELKQVSEEGAYDIALELQSRGLGSESAVTCTIGRCLRKMLSRYRNKTDLHATNFAQVRTPCKLFVRDTLVYRGLFKATPPTVKVFSDHHGATGYRAGCERDLLPNSGSAVYMGSSIEKLNVADVPHYADMLRYGFGHMKWNSEDFEIWRVRIEYPLMPSSVFVQFELKEQPHE